MRRAQLTCLKPKTTKKICDFVNSVLNFSTKRLKVEGVQKFVSKSRDVIYGRPLTELCKWNQLAAWLWKMKISVNLKIKIANKIKITNWGKCLNQSKSKTKNRVSQEIVQGFRKQKILIKKTLFIIIARSADAGYVNIYCNT
jgi:hypothetical protein